MTTTDNTEHLHEGVQELTDENLEEVTGGTSPLGTDWANALSEPLPPSIETTSFL